jgi:hypothetical protein
MEFAHQRNRAEPQPKGILTRRRGGAEARRRGGAEARRRGGKNRRGTRKLLEFAMQRKENVRRNDRFPGDCNIDQYADKFIVRRL